MKWVNCVSCRTSLYVRDEDAAKDVICNDCAEGKQIDVLDMLGMKVSYSGELYAYGTDCRKGTCD